MSTSPNSVAKQSFDLSTIISLVLGYERYLRMMGMLLTLGILMGLSAYVFKRGVFMSRNLIRVASFADMESLVRTGRGGRAQSYRSMRHLSGLLGSRHFVLAVARDLGVAGKDMSYEELRSRVIPNVHFTVLNQNNLQMEVLSFLPGVVRDYADQMVQTYTDQVVGDRANYQRRAISRYLEEMDSMRAKLDEQLQERLDYQQDTALAETWAELDNLSSIPVELVRLRYRLVELDRVAALIDGQEGEVNVVDELAMLSELKNRAMITTSPGKIINKASMASSTMKAKDEKGGRVIVVKPDMVDGLQDWEKLEKGQRELSEEIRRAADTFGDEHAVMVALRKKEREIKRSLEVELEVARRGFEVERAQVAEKIKDLDAKVEDYYATSRKFDKESMNYDILERSRQLWNAAYEKLNRDVEAMQYVGARQFVDFENLGMTALRDVDPVSPGKKQMGMLGILLGLGMAVGVPFGLMRLDTTVSLMNDLEGALGVRGLGIVPKCGSQGELEKVHRQPVAGSDVPNSLLECFRLVRSGIVLQATDENLLKVVMVTSARPGEGKTTLSANIAWAYQSMGEKTLLVDCDLRRGRMHGLLKLPEGAERGLTQYLVGDKDIRDYVLPTEVEGLDVIPRGRVVPGSTELLMSDRFSEALAELAKGYDRVVLDTPPVLGLSETTFVQNHADGYVLVVRADKTPRKDVHEAVRLLEGFGTPFLGFVLNGVDFSKKANSYNYYYYSDYYYEDMVSSA